MNQEYKTQQSICHPYDTLYAFMMGKKKPIKALVNNVELTAENNPNTFIIPYSEIRNNIPVGMMVKIIVSWNYKYLPSERFWVEVTNIAEDREGRLFYWGVCRNNTFVAQNGTPIGPFYPHHICDYDFEDFMEKKRDLLIA